MSAPTNVIASRASCWRCGGRGSYPVARIADGKWVSVEKPCPICNDRPTRPTSPGGTET